MNTETIVEALRSEGADLIVKYGSATSPGTKHDDIDLFTVGTDTTDRQHFQLGQFDVIRQSWTEFGAQRERLDPVYCTEPLLTGRPLYDGSHNFDALREQITERTPDSQVVTHNVYRGAVHLQRALAGQSKPLADPLQYTVSYWLFALWYHGGRPPTSLAQLLAATREQERFEALIEPRDSANEPVSNTRALVSDLLDLLFAADVFAGR